MDQSNYYQMLQGRQLASTIPEEIETNWKYLEPIVNILKTMSDNDRNWWFLERFKRLKLSYDQYLRYLKTIDPSWVYTDPSNPGRVAWSNLDKILNRVLLLRALYKDYQIMNDNYTYFTAYSNQNVYVEMLRQLLVKNIVVIPPPYILLFGETSPGAAYIPYEDPARTLLSYVNNVLRQTLMSSPEKEVLLLAGIIFADSTGHQLLLIFRMDGTVYLIEPSFFGGYEKIYQNFLHTVKAFVDTNFSIGNVRCNFQGIYPGNPQCDMHADLCVPINALTYAFGRDLNYQMIAQKLIEFLDFESSVINQYIQVLESSAPQQSLAGASIMRGRSMEESFLPIQGLKLNQPANPFSAPVPSRAPSGFYEALQDTFGSRPPSRAPSGNPFNTSGPPSRANSGFSNFLEDMFGSSPSTSPFEPQRGLFGFGTRDKLKTLNHEIDYLKSLKC
jgi:hypothetical protein